MNCYPSTWFYAKAFFIVGNQEMGKINYEIDMYSSIS